MSHANAALLFTPTFTRCASDNRPRVAGIPGCRRVQLLLAGARLAMSACTVHAVLVRCSAGNRPKWSKPSSRRKQQVAPVPCLLPEQGRWIPDRENLRRHVPEFYGRRLSID